NPRVAALLGLVVLALSGGTLGIYLKYCDAQKQEALARTNEALATSRAEDLEKALAERNSALGSAQSEREKAEKLAQERAVALADVQKEKAKVQNEKNHAEEERDRAKFVAYAFRLREAQGEIERGRLGQARAVLETCDPKLCLWEHEYLLRQTNKLQLDRLRHTGGVRSVAFSPDGMRVVSGSEDRTVKVSDAQTGEAT